jgi:hypothetical protein
MSIMTEQVVIDRSGIENLIPSEFFSQLVGLVSLFPYLKPLLPRFIQVRLVLDANRVYGEILWRLKRRRVAANQSGLHEAIASGLVVAYAPAFLQQEIEGHLPEIAIQARRPFVDAEREWKQFSNILHFHDPKDESAYRGRCRDGDDIAYLAVCNELASRAIYSTDKDFLSTDAPLLSVIVDTTLRDYARASSVRVGLVMGTSVSAFVGIEVLRTLAGCLVKISNALRRLPPMVQVALGVTFLACLAHPRTRARMMEAWKELKALAQNRLLVEAISDLWDAFLTVSHKEEVNYRKLCEVLPPARKTPLVNHVRSVCVASKDPLPLAELERRIQIGGYHSKAKSPRAYLLQVLRSNDSFLEVIPGCWSMRPSAAS